MMINQLRFRCYFGLNFIFPFPNARYAIFVVMSLMISYEKSSIAYATAVARLSLTVKAFFCLEALEPVAE
jgi:hypothetical protein